MRTLIKKEIRLLLPAWTGAMLLAVAPAWLIEKLLPNQNALAFVPAPLFILPGLLLLAVSSFGQEFNARTFSLLLSQPVVRHRAWRLKTSMLAMAFVLVVAAETISWCLFIQFHPKYSSGTFESFLPSLLLWAPALFAGGLWTTLLLRQEIGAFWITLLVPACILAGIGLASDCLNVSQRIEDRIADLAVLLYSVASFLFARRLFLRAQDTQWTGGTFFFWRRRRKEHASSFVFGPISNRFVVLIWKEIQLHEASLFIAAVLLVVNLASMALHPFISNVNLKTVLEFAWALWLLMPVLIGCAAVAEERRLGVAEAQLCQPVSRRAALCIKFMVALVLSVILGAVVPSLIERTRDFGITTWADFWIFIATPAIFFVSFYASTVSRSTIHAVGAAMGVSIAFWVADFMLLLSFHRYSPAAPGDVDYYSYTGRVYLMTALSAVVFPLVMARLMFWNFKWLHSGWRLFRFNAIAIAIAFAIVFISTNLIFYRSWELLFPIETTRGPARLTLQAPATISLCPTYGELDSLVAVLPDGALWQQQVDRSWINFRSSYSIRLEPNRNAQRYVGSDWKEISANEYHILGIRKDGSLWRIPDFFHSIPMTRIGSKTNWLKVARNQDNFLLLRNDGTLWRWGRTWETNDISDQIRLDLMTEPNRIDPGTNWTNLVPFSRMALARKNDGSFWSHRWEVSSNRVYSLHLIHERNLDNDWLSYAFWNNFSVEIKTNGQLWLLSQADHGSDNSSDWPQLFHYLREEQLGSESDWKTVTIEENPLTLFLLRNDGTLWKWKIGLHKPFEPVQLGRRSDWIALDPDTAIALAADGSLWHWNDPSDRIWLAPSRKPVYMGNIFEGASVTKTDTHENAD